MGRPPLPPDVDRAVRAYLAALLPAEEVRDAVHDVHDEARYWSETRLAPALRLAHGAVTQRERVADDAAVQVLVAELGCDDPTIATALGLETDDVAVLRARLSAAPPPAARRRSDAPVPGNGPVMRFGFEEDEPVVVPEEPIVAPAGHRWLAVAVVVWLALAVAVLVVTRL